MRTAFPPDLLYRIATDFDGAPRMFRDMAVCTSERLAGDSPAAPQDAGRGAQHPVLQALGVGARWHGGVATAAAAGRGAGGGNSSRGGSNSGGRNHSNENLVRLMRGIFGDGAATTASSSSSRSTSECSGSEWAERVTVFKVRQSVRWRYLFLSGTLNSVVVATRDDANRCITFQL